MTVREDDMFFCSPPPRRHQKSLGVQGGQPGSNLALNRSLKLGPGDGTHTQTHARAHKQTHTAEHMKPSQVIPLFIYFLYYIFISYSSFPLPPAKTLDNALRETVAEASALSRDSVNLRSLLPLLFIALAVCFCSVQSFTSRII